MNVEKIGRVVSTDAGPSFMQTDVKLDPGIRVTSGQLLFANIEDLGKIAILRVSGAYEVNPYESPLSSQVRDKFDMRSTRNREDLLRKYVITQTQLIDVLVEENGTFRTDEPSIIISSGTPVHEMLPGITNSVLGFPDKEKPTAMHLGHAIGNESLVVALDVNKTLPRHILVAGSTGTGKSYLIGVITEELKKLGIRHVNIDVHGELCDATNELNGINLIPGRDFTVRLSSLEEPEVLNMLPIQHQTHVDIVTRAFINLKQSQNQFTVDGFVTEALNVCDQFSAGKSTRSIIAARVGTLNNLRILGSGFDWETALQGEGALINIDCRNLGQWELQMVVGAVSRELVFLRKSGKIKPFVLSMDEAHLFLPSREKATSSQVLAELIRMGRHYGVGIMVSSQSPADIDKRITKITNTRFIFAIEPSELASISGLLGDAPPELISTLPKLRLGTCLLGGSRETVNHSLVMQVRTRITKHGGTTPKFIETNGDD